jgi:flagellar basal-body rod modification protein FlgD
MVTSPITGGSSAAPAKSPTQGLAANFDNFLKLLTTQLQKQDPLAPMDATNFTSQLVEFASVEQAIQTNTRLADLSKLIAANSTTSAMGMLGREVTADTDKVALAGEGDGLVRYRLAEPAAEVRVTVRDGQGRVVGTAVGGTAAGENLVRWDGTNAAGRRMPTGEYSVRVDASRADGSAVAVEQFVAGTVEGIEPRGGDLHLAVAGASVPIGAVRAVRQPA